jgi:hypothetical protein
MYKNFRSGKTRKGKIITTNIYRDDSVKHPNILECIYYSKILKFELYQVCTPNYGLNWDKKFTPIYIPKSDLDSYVIKLEGIEKNLTRKELLSYINVLLDSPIEQIKKEVENFYLKYNRLLTHK